MSDHEDDDDLDGEDEELDDESGDDGDDDEDTSDFMEQLEEGILNTVADCDRVELDGLRIMVLLMDGSAYRIKVRRVR